MKKSLITIFVFLCTLTAFAQVISHDSHEFTADNEFSERCATGTIDMQNAQANSQYLQNRKRLAEYYLFKSRDNDLQTRSVVTIPVVFHIVKRAGSSNEDVTDAVINAHIINWNKNFRRQNDNFFTTPSPFALLSADCEINFCLAAKDPNGNYTTGIVRYQSSHSGSWESNYEDIKNPSQGGVAPWSPTKYLNVWVTPLEVPLGGYSSFPGGNPSLDGIVANQRSLNVRPFSQDDPDAGGTILTHETGHWLGLEHIWGPGSATSFCGDDGIADTPPQARPTYNTVCPIPFPTLSYCPSFPFPNGNSPNGNMAWNFMDYATCQTMFTQGQKSRMRATLDGPRSSIQYSDGCTLPTPYIRLVWSQCIGGTEYEGTYEALPQIPDPNVRYEWLTNSIGLGGGYNYFTLYEPSVEPGRTINLTVQLKRGNLTSSIAGGDIGVFCNNNYNISQRNNNVSKAKKGKLTNLEVSPNPVSDNLLLSINDRYANCQISIIDQYGSSKMNFKYSIESQKTIDVRNFSNGLYFVVLRTNEGETISKKFIVNR